MRTLLSILIALTMAAGLAQATQNLCYGWEDGGTVLGAYLPEYMYIANTDAQAYEGDYSLEIYETGGTGTPQAYVAWISGLYEGDQVSASVQTLDYTTGSTYPSVRIWAHYTEIGGDVNSYAGSASGPAAFSGGADWVELSHTWTHPAGRDGAGLVIEIRPYNSSPWAGSNWVDYLCVIAPDHATIHFPGSGQPPVVANVYHRHLLPAPNDPVTVYADAVDGDGTIAGVTLYYRVDAGSEVSTPMALVTGDTYSATIPGQANGALVEYYVIAVDDDTLEGRSPGTGYYSYTVAPETIIPIGSIHDDYDTYVGQIVKVQGQVYIPGDYKADGVSVSAYIQGTDDRGLNVFGTVRSTGQDLLNDISYIVKVSGKVGKYYTTVQLENYEVELVSTGHAPLTPAVYSTGNAALPANEGSYIKASGIIQAIGTTAGTNPSYNFTIDDGTGPVVVRVDDDLEPDMPNWLIGEVLEAAGAGGSFNDEGQIIVGLSSDLNKYSDTTPPELVSAHLTLPSLVRLKFNEPIDPVTGEGPNYLVYETANPSNTTMVLAAVVQTDDPSVVLLTLLSAIDGVPHSVQISDVEDLSGNPISPNPTIAGIVEVLQQQVCYGWENGHDVLGALYPELMYLANTDAYSYEGGYSLEIYKSADGSTPQAYVSWITDLQEGDVVSATVMVLDNVVGTPRVRIWGHWTPPGGTVDSTAGSAGGNASYSSGIGWEELAHAWTVPADKDGHGLMIEIRPYNAEPWAGSNWVDDLCVTAPQHATIIFPGGLSDAPVPVAATMLRANFPNPFNPLTAFSFCLERDAKVTLTVFDVRGRKVRTVVDTQLSAGDYAGVYSWDGRDEQGRPATSGTYFYRLSTDNGYSESRKMTLIK